jgi:hypothetical protein
VSRYLNHPTVRDHVRAILRKLPPVKPHTLTFEQARIQAETVGGIYAADAVLFALKTELDWQSFLGRWPTPDRFAMERWPSPQFESNVREAFAKVFAAGMKERGVTMVEDLALVPARRRRSPRG